MYVYMHACVYTTIKCKKLYRRKYVKDVLYSLVSMVSSGWCLPGITPWAVCMCKTTS